MKAEGDFEELRLNLKQGRTDQRFTGGLRSAQAHRVSVVGPTIVHLIGRLLLFWCFGATMRRRSLHRVGNMRFFSLWVFRFGFCFEPVVDKAVKG